MIEFEGCYQLPADTDVIEVSTEQGNWDLHNAGEFLGFNYDVTKQQVSLRWNYYHYNSGKISHTCEINLSSVTSFEALPRDAEMPFYEDTCLSSIVYHNVKGTVAFEFRGGMKLIVRCERFSFHCVEA